MSRNGSGVYSKPAGTTFTPNTVIESAKVNEVIDDIAADLNVARPVVAGGTGATSASAALAALGADGKVVQVTKSSGYTALTTDNNAIIRFSAAATLALTAAATLAANWHVMVVADGGDVVIDPNASETINGATTITIPNGTSTVVWCTGSAFLATKDYATIAAKQNKADPFVSVASASTVDLGAQSSPAINITGSTAITSFGTSAADGSEYLLKFNASLTVTNGANLVTGINVNIGTFDGMFMLVRKDASNVWRVVYYSSRIDNTGGGTGRLTFSLNGLTASRTVTMPDGNVTLPSGTVITGADVAANVAAISAGAVGSLAFARASTSSAAYGATVAGSDLLPTAVSNAATSGALSGTWRCLGDATGGSAGSTGRVTLWLRIS